MSEVVSEIPLTSGSVAVIKIGGSILTNARAYRRAAAFVCSRHRTSPEERLVVVVSAQEGTTDALEELAAKIVATSIAEAAATVIFLITFFFPWS